MKLKTIIKKMDLSCKVLKNKTFGFTVLCFEKLPRRREICEIKKSLNKEGYNSACGFRTINVFKKRKNVDKI